MGVGAEDILVCVWRLLHFSMRTSSMCAQKHPIVSGAMLFLFLLYAFFNIFVFFSPFLVCVALVLRIFWTSGGLIILEAEQRSKNSGGVVVNNRDESSCLLKQKSRRTNVKKIEWDAQRAKEGKDFPALASPNDLVSKTVLLAKEVKALNMRPKERAFDHGESSNAKRSSVDSIVLDDEPSILDSDRDILSSSSSDDDESEKFEGGGRKEEAAQQDGTKAVQWTDDDQRNLLDLGLSEIERNKRLESLIARRRARKLFKMQIEKGLIDLDTILPSQIAPLYIARNNPYIAEMDGLETPGSAPSVMFPAKNPFDLPYDPLEEKPDLKTDSFQQEFTAATQRDMLYCRHESFCYGAAFQLEPRKRALDGLGFSRFKKQSSLGPHDRRIERMLSNKGEHDELVETLLAEVEATSISHIDSISEVVDGQATTPNQVTTSGKSKDEKNRQPQRESITEGMRKMNNDQNVAVMSTRRETHMEQHVTDDSNEESSSSEEDGRRYTATRSGYSQQPASKAGRVPPKPLNCSIPSPSNEKGLFYPERGPCHTPTYSIASDLQVEVSDIGSPPLTVDGANSPTDRESLSLDGDFEREYMWAASSSQSSRIEENESKLKDMRGFSEKDFTNMASSGNSKNNKDVVESSMHLQQPDELDDTYSLSSTMTGIQADSRTHSMSLEDVRQVVEEVGKPSISGLSDAPSPVNQDEKLKTSEKLVAQTTKSPSNPTDETIPAEVAAANTLDDLKDETKNKDRDGETKSGMSQPSEGTVGELRSKEGDSVNPVIQPIKDNKNLNSTERDLQRATKNEGSRDSKVEQHTSLNDPTAAAFPQNLMTQEEKRKSPEKSTEVAKITHKIPAQDVLPKETETAAELKTPAEEVESVSQMATDLKNTDKREIVEKKPVEEIPNVQKKAESAESKKAAEEIGSISQNASEATAEVKKTAEKTESDSKKQTEDSAELRKEFEKEDSMSEKRSMAAPELTKPAEVGNLSGKSTEAPAALKKSTEEVGSVLQKSTEASAELKKSVKETATEAPVELKKSTEESIDAPSAELKKSVEGIASVSEKSTEAPSELKKSVEGIASVSEKSAEALSEFKKSAEKNGTATKEVTKVEGPPEIEKHDEDTGSSTEKASKTVVELKSSATETGSVSEIATRDTAGTKKTYVDTGSVLQNATSASAELKKAAEEIGSISQNASEATAEVKKIAEKTKSDSKKQTEDSTELRKEFEKEYSMSEKASMTAPELTKPAEVGNLSGKSTEAPAALKKSTEEVGSVLQKSTEASAELKKSYKETATEAPVELKKSTEESIDAPSAELKKSVESIASVSEKSAEAPSELKKSAEKNGTTTKEVTKAEGPREIQKHDEDTGSSMEKASKTVVELKSSAKETGSVSEIATRDTVGTKKSYVDAGSVLQNATSAIAELKKPTEEIGIVSQKTPDTSAELKRPAEVNESTSHLEADSPAEIKKTVEDIANVSHKASEVVAELKGPAEKSDNVSGKAKEVAAMLKSPAEESGSVSQKATEVATEMKETTDEIGSLAQKANEAAIELKKSAEEIGNVLQNKAEAPTEPQKPVEETKT